MSITLSQHNLFKTLATSYQIRTVHPIRKPSSWSTRWISQLQASCCCYCYPLFFFGSLFYVVPFTSVWGISAKFPDHFWPLMGTRPYLPRPGMWRCSWTWSRLHFGRRPIRDQSYLRSQCWLCEGMDIGSSPFVPMLIFNCLWQSYLYHVQETISMGNPI